MMNNVEDILRDKYYKYRLKEKKTVLHDEVPVFSRSVDLVEFDAIRYLITAIEFKITDWKRAIMQLNEVAPCFDYLVLCFPKPKTERCLDVILKACIEKGIGLILWDRCTDSFLDVCPAQKSTSIWDNQKESIIEYVLKE